MASNENKENRNKRQNFNSPSSSSIMSPSVAAPSRKLSRLSETPSRHVLANICEIDPNIDATVLDETSSIEVKKDVAVMKSCPDANMEETLMEEDTSIFGMERTIDEMLKTDRTASSIESLPKTLLLEEQKITLCEDEDRNITAGTPSSITAVLSPGMSDEMKTAIKTYLTSGIKNTITPIAAETELSAVHVSEGWISEKNVSENLENQNLEVVDNIINSSHRIETGAEKETEILGGEMSALELADEKTEAIFCSENTRLGTMIETGEVGDVTFFDKPIPAEVSQVENEDTISLFRSRCNASELDKQSIPPNVKENLTLSVRKKEILDKRNMQPDRLSSPMELANYARERAEDYSFLINEAYCDKSMFCENCYSMRVELEFFSEKFEALAAAMKGEKMSEEYKFFIAELEHLLSKKQAENQEISMELKETKEINDQLKKQKEFLEKDVEDYKSLFKTELTKKQDEIDTLRRKLYAAEDMIQELEKEMLNKSSNDKDALLAKVDQLQAQISIVEKQLLTLSSNQHKQLENEIEAVQEKAIGEIDQLLIRLRQALSDLKDERSHWKESIESKYASGISLLEAEIAKLEEKIDEVLRLSEVEAEKQRSFLIEKLESVLEKFRTETKGDLTVNESKVAKDLSLKYFEAVVNIIQQDNPCFGSLIDIVARDREASNDHLQQLKTSLENVKEEKIKWETLYLTEKSKFNNLHETMLDQYGGDRESILNFIQDIKKMLSMARISATPSEDSLDHGVSRVLEQLATVQKDLNEKWSEGLNELQRCTSSLQKQHEASSTSSVEAEVREMNDKIKTVQEIVGKIFENSNSLQENEQKKLKYSNQLEKIRNELEELKKERDILGKMCKSTQEVQQAMKDVIEGMKKTEDLRSEREAARKNMEFENIAQVTRLSESLIVQKDELLNENAMLKNTVKAIEEESKNLKEKLKMVNQYGVKIEELENSMKNLKKENERLGAACDDADEEVGNLKQQIFELTLANAKLQAEKYGESEEAVNRRLGYIEPPSNQPKIHSPSLKNTACEEVVGATASLSESKKDSTAKKFFVNKAEIAEEALPERLTGGISPKSKTSRDQSCRTS